jgi:hypothetical protein
MLVMDLEESEGMNSCASAGSSNFTDRLPYLGLKC